MSNFKNEEMNSEKESQIMSKQVITYVVIYSLQLCLSYVVFVFVFRSSSVRCGCFLLERIAFQLIVHFKLFFVFSQVRPLEQIARANNNNNTPRPFISFKTIINESRNYYKYLHSICFFFVFFF